MSFLAFCPCFLALLPHIRCNLNHDSVAVHWAPCTSRIAPGSDMEMGVQHILSHGVAMFILVDVELPRLSLESTLLVLLCGGVSNLAQNGLQLIVEPTLTPRT